MKKPAYIMRDSSITVFVDGKPHTIEISHPNFSLLYQAILDAQYDLIPKLVTIENRIKNMSHGAIDIFEGKMFHSGVEIHGVVVDKLFAMLSEGAKDAEPLLNFIDRLMENPSANSVNELYTFLSYKSLPITPDGKFLAYKGVDNNFYSKHGNKETVVVRGNVSANGSIYNGVGEIVQVARRSVDDNKDNHCSFGLHVGSYDYASNWAGSNGRLLVVEVDPADAVSVPTDCECQKLRVSKYRVVSDITPERKEIVGAVYNENAGDGYDADSDFNVNAEASEDELEKQFINLKIRNYIDAKHSAGEYPTVKQIQSRMKGYGLSSAQIFEIAVKELGFEHGHLQSEDGFDIPYSFVSIVPAF
jgi:uncharacterized protein Usg